MKTIDMKQKFTSIVITPFMGNRSARGYAYYDHDDYDSLDAMEYHYYELIYEQKTIYFNLIANPNFHYTGNHMNIDQSIYQIQIFDSPELSKIKCAKSYNDYTKTYFELAITFNQGVNMLILEVKQGDHNHELNLLHSKNITLSEYPC